MADDSEVFISPERKHRDAMHMRRAAILQEMETHIYHMQSNLYSLRIDGPSREHLRQKITELHALARLYVQQAE